ncbi:hypothetical protein [Phyllobacterium chamaecytisi]
MMGFIGADGAPTYKRSYKHFIDLLEPLALQGKPIVLTATGGSDRMR